MILLRVAGTLIVLLLLPTFCAARSLKLAPDVHARSGESTIDVIVQFTGAPTEERHKRLERRGARVQRELRLIQAAVYSIPPAVAEELANEPDVVYVSPDRPVEAMLDFAVPTVGVPYATSGGWDGAGVGIAVIDSGVSENHDLLSHGGGGLNRSRVVYSESFVPGLINTVDQYGHGTHVAGIAAGNGHSSTGKSYTKTFRGIAPRAHVINLRVLDSNGSGTDSAVIAAIDRAIQLKNQYNIRVINISLGRPVFESYKKDPLCQAVERAWSQGIVVVVAAGNEGRNGSQGTDGYATITSPGNDPLVITVGAMKSMQTESRADDLMASYSSKGPTLLDHVVKPDLVAPGNRVISLLAFRSVIASKSSVNRILSSYYQKNSGKSFSGDYYQLSGTSMAAPMVAGTAAVMLHKDWSLTPDTVKARLMRSATKAFPAASVAVDAATGTSYTTQYDLFTVGAGYLDICAALNDSSVVHPGGSTASPKAVYDKASGTVYVVNSDTEAWD
jgi:serine protease AprX